MYKGGGTGIFEVKLENFLLYKTSESKWSLSFKASMVPLPCSSAYNRLLLKTFLKKNNDFSFPDLINTANFEAFLYGKKLSTNLLFLESDIVLKVVIWYQWDLLLLNYIWPIEYFIGISWLVEASKLVIMALLTPIRRHLYNNNGN